MSNSELPKGWRECKLGDVLDKITKGTTPPKGKGFVEFNGINYIKSDAINYDGRIDINKFAFIDKETNEKFKRSQLQEHDILLSMAGAYLGKSGLVTKYMLPANTNQALAILRTNMTICDPFFISYYLRQNSIVEFINNMSGQSAQPNVNFQEISSIPINLPPLTEQKAIAEVLSSLDDKIDLLHQQNQTLEDMAQTLFREWFIEKADEGWEEVPLSEVADFLNGLACQKFPPKNDVDKLPVLKIKDLKAGISDSSDWASTDVDSKYIIGNGDVIFSWSASLVVKIWDGEKCILNQHLFKVTSENYPKWFYYQWCKYHLDRFISISQAHATTMGHIKRKDLDNALCFVPSDNELENMNKKIQPIIEKLEINQKQIKILEQTRDTLLPKLMSGQVRV
ncbi:restriction endonuclease subunit S [Francisella tularensis subsp. novicida]|uniref:restriction endonuclease subunit S n=1 Tax=Francisella tularensis TaxID=263 RepID=UPI000501853C|nr:restriction endonuclease subunit S [Francisella tularensis]AJJ47986.1 type I restriction modification DNA specificity domain protein [Francisella tularensis subsp. novicida]APC98290.1 type I restriction modification DNA specificity domain protein [Francisella tularensis subsp. novicida]KFJ68338.1 type I restriction modification DNA specificity domain protein [Francisella tularensis subsp. novicida]MBK2344905.1 restriction endonuclease subunit S [Francisella tularensis subsp. novicida]MBK235